MKVHVIFWEPTTAPPIDPTYNSLILRYYNDVGGNRLYNMLREYPDYTGTPPTNVTLVGSWLDNSTPYPSTIEPADVQNEITYAIQKNSSWCHGSLNCYYAVYTSPNANIGFHISHFAFFYGVGAATDSIQTLWALMPYNANPNLPYSPNNCQPCDAAISLSAHEQFEAATAPLGENAKNGSPTPTPIGSGWWATVIVSGQGPEIGDLCAQGTVQYGTLTPLGTTYDNQTWNNHPYIIQEMWDDNANGQGNLGACSQGGSP